MAKWLPCHGSLAVYPPKSSPEGRTLIQVSIRVAVKAPSGGMGVRAHEA